jgi:hypothetical protein
MAKVREAASRRSSVTTLLGQPTTRGEGRLGMTGRRSGEAASRCRAGLAAVVYRLVVVLVVVLIVVVLVPVAVQVTSDG